MSRSLTTTPIEKPLGEKNSTERETSPLCGLVLAGGDGHRLRPFVEQLRGDTLPKQYVRLIGTSSMLEHTYRRAEQLVPRERLFTVVNRAHLYHPEVLDQLGHRPQETVVVQPVNMDTGAGLMLPLIYINERYGDSIVAVFPSDQFVWEENRLTRYLRLAQAIVKHHPSKLVILGIKPSYEESEYGYVLPRAEWDVSGWGTYDIRSFVEKPDILRAHDLIAQGALWNTMLLVFKSATMLRWVQELKPDFYAHFDQIRRAIGTPLEATVIQQIYDRLERVNFSRDLLEPLVKKRPGSLAVLPVNDLFWSDWGTETRIIKTLRTIGRLPQTLFTTRQKPKESPLRNKRTRSPRPHISLDKGVLS
jgi:mannose-1-phosphate guanylyltransferase